MVADHDHSLKRDSVYLPSCAVALRHGAPRRRHADTASSAPSASQTRCAPAARFSVASSQQSPEVRTCLQSLQVDRVRAVGHSAFSDPVFNLLIPKGRMVRSGEDPETHREMHKGQRSHRSVTGVCLCGPTGPTSVPTPNAGRCFAHCAVLCDSWGHPTASQRNRVSSLAATLKLGDTCSEPIGGCTMRNTRGKL